MTRANNQTPNPPRQLLDHLNRGDCVLFVGDALDEEGSQSARLASLLVDACGAHCEFCKENGKCLRPHNCTVPLTRAAQLYESRNNRQALLDFVIRQADNASSPGPIHSALAALPVRVIVTTATDDRLEEALRRAGRPYLNVVRDADVPFDDPDRVQLIRLHGTVSQPDSLVLTEDDAADLFARLPTVTKILQGHFASKTLLFVGYGLSDPHFLTLYRQVTGPIARYRRLAYGVQWPPDPLAVDRWRGKVQLIEAQALPFLAKLTQSIRVRAVEEERAALPPEPYKFLDYYTREDAAIFYGRDLEADLLLSTVLAHKLTVFYGRSGTGKTSLLLARVAPALEEKEYRVAYARMLGDPTAEVKAAVRQVHVSQLSPTDQARRLRDVLPGALPPSGRLVVVLDQFEEFFLRQGDEVRRAFAREMADCLWPTLETSEDLRGLDVRFVLSLRDDYLGSLDELGDALSRDVFAHRYKLENLTREKALLAILKPAEAFGLSIGEPLREQLITDLEDQGLEPANLQIVLYRLYRDAVEQGLWSSTTSIRGGTGLTLTRYHDLGGTGKILAGYLDEVLAALDETGTHQQARAVLKSMVTADRTKAALSGREIARGDLVAKVGLDDAQLDDLLAYLRERRVVRKFGDEDRYELAHEVMVEKVWAWVSDEELRLLDVRDMLRREMSNYEKFGHLLTRERLEMVTACCESLALDDAEQELLFRSALAEDYEVSYWRDRAPAVTGKVERELFGGLGADDPDEAQKTVSSLTALASPGIVDRLAEVVEADFDAAPVIWVDHQGHRVEARRTALNLSTPRQQRALLALAKMTLPEAVTALEQWTPPGTILIPAGPFTMGSTERSNEGPIHQVRVEAFWIDRYPVTNAQWAAFLESDAWQRRELWTEAGWEWKQSNSLCKGNRNKPDHPVVSVCWYESLAYARWAGKALLSEAQWEKAARGTDERRYPWGDGFDKDRCNTNESNIGTTMPVGKYSPVGGDSPYGVSDMVGNVWEWTASLSRPYPCRQDDERNDPNGTGSRVLRGGSFRYSNDLARSTYRLYNTQNNRNDNLGFRVVVAPFSPTFGLG
ncbi:MAG: SUMF1/EgtB/PvdO family nonheme iron enzyme [Chloroflexi bacterium]|nr:SUMF1/EgtB/PvdO family nonheme iron enzyme [Chloroflexota bacterium]